MLITIPHYFLVKSGMPYTRNIQDYPVKVSLYNHQKHGSFFCPVKVSHITPKNMAVFFLTKYIWSYSHTCLIGLT